MSFQGRMFAAEDPHKTPAEKPPAAEAGPEEKSQAPAFVLEEKSPASAAERADNRAPHGSDEDEPTPPAERAGNRTPHDSDEDEPTATAKHGGNNLSLDSDEEGSSGPIPEQPSARARAEAECVDHEDGRDGPKWAMDGGYNGPSRRLPYGQRKDILLVMMNAAERGAPPCFAEAEYREDIDLFRIAPAIDCQVLIDMAVRTINPVKIELKTLRNLLGEKGALQLLGEYSRAPDRVRDLVIEACKVRCAQIAWGLPSLAVLGDKATFRRAPLTPQQWYGRAHRSVDWWE